MAQARQQTYAAINVAMVEAYWQIGRRIVEEEQNGQTRADYSTFLIRELSRQLTAEFGRGFSVANLKNFRKFYLTFPDFIKGYTASSLLSWSHYCLIMRVDNLQAREYYLTETATQGWSVRQLERNIHTLYYERLLLAPDKKTALAQEYSFDKASPGEFVKDPYVLEFL